MAPMSDLGNMQRMRGYGALLLSGIPEFPHVRAMGVAQLMAAAHEELVRPQVMTAVEDLMAREASGVLEITGNPSGAFYMDGGRIVFARASWVPGLAARLRAILPAPPGPGDLPPGQDADDASLAGFAVQRGYLTPAGLHELIRSVVVDAFLVLTIPLVMDTPVPAMRFTATRTYWTELFPRLGIDHVRGKALRMAERMAEHGLGPTTAVVRCDLRAPAAVLTREQWAVACQLGEPATALDLAARRGAALADTLECLCGLTRAGLCTPVRISARGQRRPRGPGQPAVLPSKPPRGERLPVRSPAQDRLERRGNASQAPTLDVLRQVLSGLRKLS
jgi:hypothetical protein